MNQWFIPFFYSRALYHICTVGFGRQHKIQPFMDMTTF